LSLLKTMLVRLLLSRERDMLLDKLYYLQHNQEYCFGIEDAYELIFKEEITTAFGTNFDTVQESS
jgi:hypothetical protein